MNKNQKGNPRTTKKVKKVWKSDKKEKGFELQKKE